jgi:hypothetical protein
VRHASAFITAGAGVYLGWDLIIVEPEAVEVAENVFARLLGPLVGVPADFPPYRPVDVEWAFEELAGKLSITFGPLMPELHSFGTIFGPNHMLRPSITALDFRSYDSSILEVRGAFGELPMADQAQHIKVSVGGQPVVAVSVQPAPSHDVACWMTPNETECPDEVDAVVADSASGDVVVTIDGLTSEAIPITSWQPTFTTTYGAADFQNDHMYPCTANLTWNVHLRGDLHEFRRRPTAPGEPPSPIINLTDIPAAPDSTMTYVVSGSGTYNGATVTCMGGGSAKLALEPPASGASFSGVASYQVLTSTLDTSLIGRSLLGAISDPNGVALFSFDVSWLESPVLVAGWNLSAGMHDDWSHTQTTWTMAPATSPPLPDTPQ